MPEVRLDDLTTEQKRAVTADEGAWLVVAAAGSGKTRVIERRFAWLVHEGKAAIDEVLTMTFTRKAAAEMADRIRKQFSSLGATAVMRQIDRAEISTIDSFCSNLVRRHALALGLDPGYDVAEEDQAGILQREAFDVCLSEITRSRGAAAIDIIAAYEPNRTAKLFKTISNLYNALRCRGQEEPLFQVPAVDLAEPRAALRQAVEAAVEAIRASDANAPATVSQLDALLEALVEDNNDKAIRLLKDNKPRAQGKNKEAIKSVQAALEHLLAWHQSVAALPTLELMRDLLISFHQEYAAIKRVRGLLDFSDLELHALKLLREHEEIRQAVAGSYRYTMVDEFQDTNPLQFDIMRLIAPGNLFLVGDANQSIYRFRNAEVKLFQELHMHADDKTCIKLPDNFRSQPEILGFIDSLFSQPGMFNSDCGITLRPATSARAPEMPFRVEVLMVDSSSISNSPKARKPLARSAEAELIARRLHDLFASKKFTYGDAAILVRTGSDVETYSQALDRYQIPNYLSIGRDYYKQLEFGDALNLLRLIVNPLDDLALIGVLRSPMVAVSDETLLRLRVIAGSGDSVAGQPLWPTLAYKSNLERFEPEERDRLERFVDDLRSLRERSRYQSLEDTVRAAIDYRDYRAIAAAGVNGKQACANLLKLRDKAAAYEAALGRDLPEMVDYLSGMKLEESKETQAPTEEEKGGGAVRIMTVHGAKGLEFPLVVWANMGGSGGGEKSYVLQDEEGRVGLRFKQIGMDKAQECFDYKMLAAREAERDLEEEKRIGYVAMTRAQSHLILCGSGDIDCEPAGFDSAVPIDWVRTRLGLSTGNEAIATMAKDALSGPVILEDGGAPVGFTLCTAPQKLMDDAGAGAARDLKGDLPALNPAITKMPEPARYQPGVISPTDIDTYYACALRYYLERVIKLGAVVQAQRRQPAGPGGDRELDATDMGTLVHAVLEKAEDLSPQGLLAIEDAYLRERALGELGPDITMAPSDLAAARALLARFSELDTAKELASAAREDRLDRERGFNIMVGETIINGKIDALITGEDGSLVVDYKTGASDPGGRGDGAGKYHYQMASYSLAAARMNPGPVRVVLMFLGGGGGERVADYSLEDVGSLEGELLAAIDGIGGGFAPLAELAPGQCDFCGAGPYNMRLCPTARKLRP